MTTSDNNPSPDTKNNQTGKTDNLRKLLTSYRYPGYPPTDLSIRYSFDQPYLRFDSSTNRFCHPSNEELLSSSKSRNGTTPRLIIYMIPGNPGLTEFYDQFLTDLSKSLDGIQGCEIVCSAHLGHSLRHNSNLDFRFLENFKLWKNFKSLTTSHHQQSTLEYGTGSLADHVDYHCQVVGQILNNGIGDPSRTKVVIIGHSVGGYIATKVLERYPDQVMHIIGLFPTISHIARSPNGRRLSRLFSPILLPFINMLQIVVCLTLPKIALCWLIKKLYSPLSGTFDKSRPIKESEVVETQKKEMTISENNLMIILNFILNINSVSAVLKMARSEMESIRELDTKFIHQFHQKLTLFWTSHQADEWVGETEITEIVDILNPYNHHSSKESGDEHLSHRGNELRSSNEIPTWRRMDEGIPHAFCLKHNQVMAKECSLLIKNRLLSDT
ncbi:hypothetical protein MJO28_003669 [Puccinia striiformis f. sp. tritici]|uniref:AB hydrolase-1 domain-containing protein n=2 Tax=Puccinia striiformis TaxID=27350 RepID=A0A2S4VS45_9BASI|nr:hypothetical protein MJO28_003669 [Puccinia striiformis f. sp. tritici]POW12363.1 hypothetical protein PSTT_04543 [Puccinia striiformis]